MSSVKSKNPPDVLVRAFGNEPLRLLAVAAHGHLVAVVGRDPNNPVYFPAVDVFTFNAKLFARLRAAFESKAVGDLAALWSKAAPMKEAA